VQLKNSGKLVNKQMEKKKILCSMLRVSCGTLKSGVSVCVCVSHLLTSGWENIAVCCPQLVYTGSEHCVEYSPQKGHEHWIVHLQHKYLIQTGVATLPLFKLSHLKTWALFAWSQRKQVSPVISCCSTVL
jgi:hypothetical protein